MESWIQKHALMLLLRNETAKVKQLRPDGVEANLFSYHLDGLAKDGFIKKVARGEYALTPLGERHVGALSTASNTKSEYIKTVIMLYARAGDSYLLFRWSRQPYLGKIGFVQDHLPLGRSLEDGLIEAMGDKLNSKAHPTYKKSVLIKVKRGGVLVSHMNTLVYDVDLKNGRLPYESRNGTAFLGDPHSVDAMDGLEELFESIERDDRFYEMTLSY